MHHLTNPTPLPSIPIMSISMLVFLKGQISFRILPPLESVPWLLQTDLPHLFKCYDNIFSELYIFPVFFHIDYNPKRVEFVPKSFSVCNENFVKLNEWMNEWIFKSFRFQRPYHISTSMTGIILMDPRKIQTIITSNIRDDPSRQDLLPFCFLIYSSWYLEEECLQ